MPMILLSELEHDKRLPFLGTLDDYNNKHISTSVQRKPTHTWQYINKKSNHPQHVKKESSAPYTHKLLQFVPQIVIHILKLTTF